jgi:hypothetical protein
VTKLDANDQKVRPTGLPTKEITRIMTCCHGVSALKSTVTSPVPVIPLTQRKSASMYLMLNAPLDAERMPAATIGKSVLIWDVNRALCHRERTHKRVR